MNLLVLSHRVTNKLFGGRQGLGLRLKLRKVAGLIDFGRVKNAFLQLVPISGLKRARFHFARSFVVVLKGIVGHALILTATPAFAQDLSIREIKAIRRVCRARGNQLDPMVTKTRYVPCQDFERWLGLKQVGDEKSAEKLTREIYAERKTK